MNILHHLLFADKVYPTLQQVSLGHSFIMYYLKKCIAIQYKHYLVRYVLNWKQGFFDVDADNGILQYFTLWFCLYAVSFVLINFLSHNEYSTDDLILQQLQDKSLKTICKIEIILPGYQAVVSSLKTSRHFSLHNWDRGFITQKYNFSNHDSHERKSQLSNICKLV